MSSRSYVPVRPEHLAALLASGAVDYDGSVHTVTEELRRQEPGGDQEDWEDSALQGAAADAVASGQPVAVLAIDLDDLDTASAASSAVPWSGRFPLARAASLHLGDDVVLGTDVSADSEGGLELSWYDISELDHVVSLLRTRTGR